MSELIYLNQKTFEFRTPLVVFSFNWEHKTVSPRLKFFFWKNLAICHIYSMSCTHIRGISSALQVLGLPELFLLLLLLPRGSFFQRRARHSFYFHKSISCFAYLIDMLFFVRWKKCETIDFDTETKLLCPCNPLPFLIISVPNKCLCLTDARSPRIGKSVLFPPLPIAHGSNLPNLKNAWRIICFPGT